MYGPFSYCTIMSSSHQEPSKTTLKFCFYYLARYKVRWFLNGPVLLVLVWNCILWVIIKSPSIEKQDYIYATLMVDDQVLEDTEGYIISLLSCSLWIFSAFISVWLIGWKLKFNDVVLLGLAITSLGVLLDNILYLAATGHSQYDISVEGARQDKMWVEVLHNLLQGVISVGSAPIVTSMFQLAMEQIPEASSDQASSLVSWFVFSTALGMWLSAVMGSVYSDCITSSGDQSYEYLPCYKLIFATLTALVLCSILLLKHRLLDYMPASNSMHLIYDVLKYSLKNKSPENRSALTYWEENPPSRLNLGKSKYGGPFTNEQVEDVKTFLQMSILNATIFYLLSAVLLNDLTIIYFTYENDTHTEWPVNNLKTIRPNLKSCHGSFSIFFLLSGDWWQMIFILLHELVLAPAFSYRLPSMLQRIGFAGGAAILLCTFVAVMALAGDTKYELEIDYIGLMTPIAIFTGFIKAFFYIAGLEFICAQSPYSMRNFFIALGWSIIKASSLTAILLFALWNATCHQSNCSRAYPLVTLLLAILGLVVFCIAARRYRKRTRGHEDEHQQRWVEDTYNKYMEDSIKYHQEEYWLTEK